MKADGFANQVIIYSKHWYGRTDNIIDDLKRLLAEYTGNNIDIISEHDIWQILTATFEEFVPLYARQEALFEMLGKKWAGFAEYLNRTPEQIMVGNLTICKGECADMSKKMDFSLDGIDHPYPPSLAKEDVLTTA